MGHTFLTACMLFKWPAKRALAPSLMNNNFSLYFYTFRKASKTVALRLEVR